MELSDLPPAVQAAIEQQQMTATAFRHDVQRLFEEASKEHIGTLRQLFRILCESEDGRYASYLEGVAATTLRHRFDVCPTCLVNHDEELLAHPDKPDAQPALMDGRGEPTPEALPDEPTYEDYLRECKKFNVEPIGVEGAVKCLGCDKEYVSLADRMVKPPGPEHCEGCVHKTKWG